jgi:hypothetical protein
LTEVGDPEIDFLDIAHHLLGPVKEARGSKDSRFPAQAMADTKSINAQDEKRDMVMGEETQTAIEGTLEIHHSAARVIQRWFRRCSLHRGGGAGGPLFRGYSDTAATVLLSGRGEKQRKYALTLRGLMPHVGRSTTMLIEGAKAAIDGLNAQIRQARNLDGTKAMDEVENLGIRRKEARSLLIIFLHREGNFS